MDSELATNPFRGLLSWNAVLTLVGVWFGYRVLLALYNISPFHPLARFPGPKIAAASYLYEAWYDWILIGRYGHKIREMHERYGTSPFPFYIIFPFFSVSFFFFSVLSFFYPDWFLINEVGPIVRINPDELHCNDPLFVDEIYAGPGRPRDKWQHQLNTGGAGPVSVTGFSTVDHDLHRLRKGALSRFFSRQQTLKLESEVLDFASLTVDKILQSSGKSPFDIKEAFNCFTADVISQYAFGEPMGFVSQEGWEPNLATWAKSFFNSAYMMRHNAPARKMANVLPMVADYLGEDVKAIMRQMNVVIPGYIRQALKDEGNSRGRVFAEVVKEKKLPPEEMTMYRLSGEGFNFLLAGTETTAVSLLLSGSISAAVLLSWATWERECLRGWQK
jgi:cytochrome P450